MAVTEKEALAGLRILIAVAKADGVLHPAEEEQLTFAFAGVQLPENLTIEKLLAEDNTIETLAAEVTSKEAREQIFASAYGMSFADGECTLDEKKLLDYIHKSWNLDDKKTSILSRFYQETKDTVLPSNIMPIADPKKRAAEIREDMIKYSVFSAVLGAFPVPGLAIITDLGVVAVQVKMARDIGLYWGHKVDDKAIKSLMGALGIGTGARIAVSNLCKLVPIWGSVVGASTSFATTWALGVIADKYFAAGMKVKPEDLKKEFNKAKKDGEKVYEENKARIEQDRKVKEAKLKKLAEDLKSEKITREDYERKVQELA
ncbi:MAG: hypothetical protein WC712_02765 [Candidatus Brocadiia bacterium]